MSRPTRWGRVNSASDGSEIEVDSSTIGDFVAGCRDAVFDGSIASVLCRPNSSMQRCILTLLRSADEKKSIELIEPSNINK